MCKLAVSDGKAHVNNLMDRVVESTEMELGEKQCNFEIVIKCRDQCFTVGHDRSEGR